MTTEWNTTLLKNNCKCAVFILWFSVIFDHVKRLNYICIHPFTLPVTERHINAEAQMVFVMLFTIVLPSLLHPVYVEEGSFPLVSKPVLWSTGFLLQFLLYLYYSKDLALKNKWCAKCLFSTHAKLKCKEQNEEIWLAKDECPYILLKFC